MASELDPKRPLMRPWIKRLSALRRRGQLPLVMRGRRFTYRGIRTIMRCVSEYYFEGRTKISEAVCVRLGWRQPNGWLKDRACRDVLRKLEKLHLVKLPPLMTPKSPKKASRDRIVILDEVVEPLVAMPTVIQLEFAKGNDAERTWNALIERHHYLGHRVQVGRCLKYLVRGNDALIGAISFSSPAWKLAARDNLLAHIGIEGAALRDLVINNSRFCILPHARVPHLASRVLAYATRQVAVDWLRFYAIKPLLAETFVEPKFFEGTCYRAANWHEIGLTTGYAKVGASHHNSQQPKKLFVYGLTRACRRKLAVVVPSLNYETAD